MADSRSLSLSELAKYGFSDLSSTLPKLENLVELVGDNARSALASLARSANPDQALNYLLNLTRVDLSKIKKLLGKEDSANRLCRLLGASEAMGDLLMRRPELLAHFDKRIDELRSAVDLREILLDSVAGDLSSEFD